MVESTQWNTALQRVPKESLKEAINPITSKFEVAPLELPEAGLLVLQMEDGISGEAFLMGELTGARASVRLKERDGNHFDGAAIIMKDDAELAQWIAICDAVLTHRPGDFESIEHLVEEGMEKLEEERHVRKSILSSTSVDFSLLEETEEPSS